MLPAACLRLSVHRPCAQLFIATLGSVQNGCLPVLINEDGIGESHAVFKYRARWQG